MRHGGSSVSMGETYSDAHCSFLQTQGTPLKYHLGIQPRQNILLHMICSLVALKTNTDVVLKNTEVFRTTCSNFSKSATIFRVLQIDHFLCFFLAEVPGVLWNNLGSQTFGQTVQTA